MKQSATHIFICGAGGGFWPVADAGVAGLSVRNWIKFRRQSQARLTVVMGFFKALSPCLIGMEACATAHY